MRQHQQCGENFLAHPEIYTPNLNVSYICSFEFPLQIIVHFFMLFITSLWAAYTYWQGVSTTLLDALEILPPFFVWLRSSTKQLYVMALPMHIENGLHWYSISPSVAEPVKASLHF